ncbi:MAG TPA: competence protein ComEC, partial [Usitatibacter sp.]|nr:competence protein ComEC [Usitatibacter sp.]
DDHSGGALSIAASRDPPWLLTSLAPGDPLHEAFERSTRCEAGMRWRWDGVDFAVLHPAREAYEPSRRARKENDRSCVLRVATAGAAALLTGDIEARSEAEMLARDANALPSQVLIVPHHGSKTSSTAAFIEAVHPAVGILSVGYRNRFRHPAEAVVARYRDRGVGLRRTDEEGALRVVLPARPADGLRIEPLVADRRYWSERARPP